MYMYMYVCIYIYICICICKGICICMCMCMCICIIYIYIYLVYPFLLNDQMIYHSDTPYMKHIVYHLVINMSSHDPSGYILNISATWYIIWFCDIANWKIPLRMAGGFNEKSSVNGIGLLICSLSTCW